MLKAYYFLVWTRVRLPPAPLLHYQNYSNACKINDLQAFVFLANHKTFNIYQSVGAEFGGLEKQMYKLHRI